jgi:hypothetical protein
MALFSSPRFLRNVLLADLQWMALRRRAIAGWA